MIDSAWIVPLLVKELNSKNNLLYEDHRRLKELFGDNRDIIVLLDPDG